MKVLSMELRQTPDRKAKIIVTLDTPPGNLSKITAEVGEGKAYDLTLKPHKDIKSDEQRMACWGKIGEIAQALQTSKEEVYEELLRRYAPSQWVRIVKEDVPDVAGHYRLFDVKKEHSDGSVTCLGYKGLSEMKTDEASAFLDGILSECKEIGLSGEVE